MLPYIRNCTGRSAALTRHVSSRCNSSRLNNEGCTNKRHPSSIAAITSLSRLYRQHFEASGRSLSHRPLERNAQSSTLLVWTRAPDQFLERHWPPSPSRRLASLGPQDEGGKSAADRRR